MFRKVVGTAALVVAAMVLTLPSAAQAATQVRDGSDFAATGVLTLYTNPDFTGRSVSVSYQRCPYAARPPLAQVGSVNNRPAAGCVATLVNSSGQVYRLCIGRSVVPPAFRASPQVRIALGASIPC